MHNTKRAAEKQSSVGLCIAKSKILGFVTYMLSVNIPGLCIRIGSVYSDFVDVDLDMYHVPNKSILIV